MRNLLGLLIAGLLFTFSTSLLTAQASKDRLYKITTTQVSPSKVIDYEKAIANFGDALRAVDATEVEIHAYRTNDFHYFFAEPVNNMAELFTNKWTATVEKVGEEKFTGLLGKAMECERERREDFFLYKGDLSYRHASLKGQKQNYRVWTAYQFKAGTKEEAVALCKEFKALYQKHDISVNYAIYFSVLGTNDNTVLVLDVAKDAFTYEQQQKELAEKLGKELQPLIVRLYATLDKVEIKRGYYLSKFSNVPGAAPASVAKKEDE